MTLKVVPAAARRVVELVRLGVAGRAKLWAAVMLADSIGSASQMLVIAVLALIGRIAEGQIGDIGLATVALEPILMTLTGALDVDRRGATWITAGLSGVLLIALATVLRYVAARIARHLARDFHRVAMEEIWTTLSNPASGGQFDIAEDRLRIGIMQDTLHASKAVELVSRIPQIAVFSLGAVAVAVYFEPLLTGALLGFSLLFLPLIALVSRSIRLSAREFYSDRSREHGRRVSQWVAQRNSLGSSEPRWIDADSEWLDRNQEYLDSYDKLQLATDRMNLATGIARTAGFGCAIVALVTLLVVGEMQSTDVLTYAAVLYVLMSFVQQLFGNLATFSIYYPQVVSYLSLRESLCVNSAVEEAASSGAELLLEVCDTPESGYLNALVCEPGSIVDLVTEHPLGWLNAKYWAGAVEAASNQGVLGSYTIARNIIQHLPELTMAELSCRLQVERGFDLPEFFDRLGLADEWLEFASLHSMQSSLERKIWSQATGAVQGGLLHALILSSSLNQHVLMDVTYVSRFHGSARRFLLDAYSRSCLWLLRGAGSAIPETSAMVVIWQGKVAALAQESVPLPARFSASTNESIGDGNLEVTL